MSTITQNDILGLIFDRDSLPPWCESNTFIKYRKTNDLIERGYMPLIDYTGGRELSSDTCLVMIKSLSICHVQIRNSEAIVLQTQQIQEMGIYTIQIRQGEAGRGREYQGDRHRIFCRGTKQDDRKV